MPWHLASPSIIIYRQFDQQVFVYLLIDGEIIIDQIVEKKISICTPFFRSLFVRWYLVKNSPDVIHVSTFVFRYYRTSLFCALASSDKCTIQIVFFPGHRWWGLESYFFRFLVYPSRSLSSFIKIQNRTRPFFSPFVYWRNRPFSLFVVLYITLAQLIFSPTSYHYHTIG